MKTKLLVSNLSRDIDASTLEDMFTSVGDVTAVRIVCDATTGVSKGIAHIEMSNDQQAQDCIDHFNGQSARGCVLSVREDKPHVPKIKALTSSALARRAVGSVVKRRRL